MNTPASRSPANALHWIGGAGAIGWTIWQWHTFSGPFRQLIAWQVRLTGGWYWEPLAVALLVGALLCLVVAFAELLDPLVPRLRGVTWAALFVLVAAIASGAALAKAWHLWTKPEASAPQSVPPLRDLDIDRLDTQLLPPGPVRVIGRVDRQEQIWLRKEPRGYEIYQPVAGLHRPLSETPVPVLAVCWDRYGRDCIPAALDGWLVADGLEGRALYRLRRAGAIRTQHHYLLLPGLSKPGSIGEEGSGDAVAIVLSVAALWATIAITLIHSPPWRKPAGQASSGVGASSSSRAAGPNDRLNGESAARPPNLYLLAAVFAGAVLVILSVLAICTWISQFM